ncbi:MAG: rhodanese-like domain-containing protein [Gammaproteobacteria bacterium]|nr:rhodanese-like domain-containing protein [Gammaproteobacteria bacterium]MBT4812129.1 rhodanese-like domain-containing protein [Thiotrichales bacterium]
MKLTPLLLVFTLLSTITAPLYAARVLTPETLEGGTIITPQDASRLPRVKIYDLRKTLNFAKGHLPGAVSLPFKPRSAKQVGFDDSKDKLNFSKLPSDPATPILFYSDGAYGWKSYKAAIIAIRNGFQHVYWLREGFSGWKKSALEVSR